MNLYTLLNMSSASNSHNSDTVAAQATTSTPGRQKTTLSSIEEEPQPKFRFTCIECSEEPNVLVVVGGIEFREYQQALRCWSGYFDAAFRSGMKETQSKRFEFPNRKPEEWEWIVSLMAPLTRESITPETVPVALDWFDELCCTRGLEACDRVWSEQRLEKLVSVKELTACQLESVLEDLGMCIEFDLKKSKAKCFAILRQALTKSPKLFTTDKELLGQITILSKEHQECYKALWSALKAYIPPSINEEKVQLLLDNDLLHEFIFLEMSLYPFPRRAVTQCGDSNEHQHQDTPDSSVNTTNATCSGAPR